MRGARKLLRDVMVIPPETTGRNIREVNILIDHDKIVEVNPGAEFTPATGEFEDLDCRGLLAIPGLINGHFHSSTNLMKGRLDGLPLELFMLHEVPPLGGSLPPDRMVYVRTMLGAIEMLKPGITSVQDRCVFLVPFPSPGNIDARSCRLTRTRDCGHTVALDQPNVRRIREVSVPQGSSSRGQKAPVRKGTCSRNRRASRPLRLLD